MAACAVLLLLAHLLLAQLTLGLAVAFTADRPGQPVAAVVADRAGRGRVGLGAGDRAGARGAPDSRPGPRTSSTTSAGGAWRRG